MRPNAEPAGGLGKPAAVLAALTAAIYAPVLTGPYGFADDYLLLHSAHQQPGAMADLELRNGRPLMLAAHLLLFRLADTVTDLAWLRGVTVLGLAAVAIVVFRICIASGRPRWISAAVAMAVVTLPCFWVATSWTLLFVVPPTVLTAMWASWRVEVHGEHVAPFLALTAAALTYQPAAMAYCLPVVLLATGAKPSGLPTRKLLEHGRVLVPAGLISVAAWLTSVAVNDPARDSRFPTGRLDREASWFLTEVMPRALVPFGLGDQRLLAALAGLFLVGGLLLVSKSHHLSIWRAGQLLCILPLAYAPSLAAGAQPIASARTMTGLAPVTLVLLIHASEGWASALLHRLHVDRRALPGALTVLMALLLGGEAFFGVWLYVVKPQRQEFAAAVSALAAAPAGSPIVASPARPSTQLAPYRSYDELGLPTTVYDWAPRYVVLAARRELTGAWGDTNVLYVPLGDPPPAGYYWIDFDRLLRTDRRDVAR